MGSLAHLGPKDRARLVRARRTLDLALCVEDPWSAIVSALDCAIPRRGSMVYSWNESHEAGRVSHSLGGRGWESLRGAREGVERMARSRPGTDPRVGRPTNVLQSFGGSRERAEEFRAVVLAPVDIVDQLRVTLYDRGRFLAWVGVLQGPGDERLGLDEARVLAHLVPEVRRVLLADRSLSLGYDAAVGRGVGQILDALPGPAMLLDGRGRVLFANRAARIAMSVIGPLVTRPREIPASLADVTQIDLEGRAAWLVLPRNQDARAPNVAVLPPALREIATLLASGLSDKEIAERTERPLRTVRTYVERVFRGLGARSRAEVAMLTWGGVPTPTQGRQG